MSDDGNIECSWKWSPQEESCRYVECMGGVEAVHEKAQQFRARGDLPFAKTLMGHANNVHEAYKRAYKER